MKRILLLIVTMMMLLLAIGCSTDSKETSPTAANTSEQKVEPADSSAPATDESTTDQSTTKTAELQTSSLDEVLRYFEEQGIEADNKDKPLFEMIDAIDGVMFYSDLKVVKIYQYDSIEAYEEAKASNSILDQMQQKGIFVLETKDQKIKDLFEQLP